MRYIGKSKRKICMRFADHRGYVNSVNSDMTTGIHFKLPGHSISNMTITVIEQCKRSDLFYRRERESYFIKKFGTHLNGLNKKP